MALEIQYRITRRGDVPALTEVTGICRSAIYRKIKEGEFPPGVLVGNCRVWPESQIKPWLEKNGLVSMEG